MQRMDDSEHPKEAPQRRGSWLLADLKDPRLLWLKAGLFVGIGGLSVALLLIENPRWEVALLTALAVWSFCRAYYFAFYVLERYIDPGHRFSGLVPFVRYILKRRTGTAPERTS